MSGNLTAADSKTLAGSAQETGTAKPEMTTFDRSM